MAHDRKFRFAAQLSKAPDGSAALLGRPGPQGRGPRLHALLMPDHFGDQLAPVPALAAVAAATTTLRMGSLVFGNDYRHPFVLAKEAATLDVLSDGRFELSLGAGWMRTDYDEAGLTYDHPAVRVARFEEAVKVVQGLLRTDGPFNFHGEHYEVLGHTLTPRPVQRPGPPLIIGGGGKRVLSFAARHADIVSINVNLREGTGGAETAADATPERTRTKIGWVKEAAGDRFDDLELNSLIGFVMVTDDAPGLAAQMAPAFGIDAGDALHVPLALIGTLDEMAEELEWRRAEYGISYWSIESDAWETLGPVVRGWPARDHHHEHRVGGHRRPTATCAASASSPSTRRPSAPSATSPSWSCTASRRRRSTTPPCSTGCGPGGASCCSTCSGYGLSAKPDRAYTMALQADVAAAFVAELGVDRLALLTHDMGDTVGGELLARAPRGRGRSRSRAGW